jgi:hypothetical protein
VKPVETDFVREYTCDKGRIVGDVFYAVRVVIPKYVLFVTVVVEYLHRDPASRRRRRKGKSQM